MRIIIAGAGDVGSHLAQMLSSEKHKITLIDTREERLKEIVSDIDLHTHKGSATSNKVLSDVNMSTADLFISVTNSEHANITAAILAKKMGARKCLARIDNLEYLEAENMESFAELGIDYMFYPEQLAASEIVNVIQQSASTDVMHFAGGHLMLYVMRMDENAPALNQSLEEFQNLSRARNIK